MNILGIWDGHDSGAALVVDGGIAAAINEERLTRRKLETGFPRQSVAMCLELAGLGPDQIDLVAASTTDPAKTLTRCVPGLKEEYYEIRRRRRSPGRLTAFKKRFKYRFTEWRPNALSRALSRRHLRSQLDQVGLTAARLELLDHHACHAAGAAFGSGWDECAVLTLDGVGDGLSATVSHLAEGKIRRLAASAASHSLGILFEHATNLLHMRELEDEGKVMALADYAASVDDQDNPVLDLVRVDGLELRGSTPGHALRPRLEAILWRTPPEQFAQMVQRTVEVRCAELAAAACRATRSRRLALAGGVASNIKANRRIRLLPEVDEVFVFPHMGDGGLALGGAMLATAEHSDSVPARLRDLGLGPATSERGMEEALRASGLSYERPPDLPAAVAGQLADDRVVLWHQGRMEYGPRALGHRSVLARPDRPQLRDRLNLVLKRRVWYQPFCPSMTEQSARRVLSDLDGTPNRHMTMAYAVRPECRDQLAGVISVDGTCRPQIVDPESDGAEGDGTENDGCAPFQRLLAEIERRLGLGVLLNTSLNIHGEPLVCSAQESIDVLVRSGADALALGPFLASSP